MNATSTMSESALRQLLFATSNPHKIEEVRAVLEPLGWRVVGLDQMEIDVPEPVEDGVTFMANARIKAQYYAAHTNQHCLADDSGLEVDALDGEPGVYSARYAGEGNTRPERDQANNAKLLNALASYPPEKRTARFVCTMCLAAPDQSILAESRGTFEGIIAPEPRGHSGFGYDPLVYLPELGQTVAELSAEEKNAQSHRGQAARQMAEKIKQIDVSAG